MGGSSSLMLRMRTSSVRLKAWEWLMAMFCCSWEGAYCGLGGGGWQGLNVQVASNRLVRLAENGWAPDTRLQAICVSLTLRSFAQLVILQAKNRFQVAYC